MLHGAICPSVQLHMVHLNNNDMIYDMICIIGPCAQATIGCIFASIRLKGLNSPSRLMKDLRAKLSHAQEGYLTFHVGEVENLFPEKDIPQCISRYQSEKC